MSRFSKHLWLPALLSVALCAPVEAGEISNRTDTSTRILCDFEKGNEGWHIIQADGREKPAEVGSVSEEASRAAEFAPGNVLRVPLSFPGAITIRWAKPQDWSGVQRLSYDLFLPRSGAKIQIAAYVKDADLRWYQTSALVEPPGGRWESVSLDVSPESHAWLSEGHHRPWSGYVSQRIMEFGIKLFCKDQMEGVAYFDNFRLEEIHPAKDEPIHLLNFSTNAANVGRFEKFEITFELPRAYSNPFDPEVIDIRAHFISPSGLVTTAPGFFHQDYVREFERNVERLIPVGRSVWKVRFTPRELGEYEYYLEIKDGRELRTARRRFRCVPSSRRGFVRISTRDPNYFEFENGEFFYPIGHNIPATYNIKNAANLGLTPMTHAGTFAYDRFLNGMGRAKENFARIWLASWSFGLEWSRKYDVHYADLGRYNLENAWRLDYVLDLAERNDVLVQLALTTFGHWRSATFEGDWHYNPYNVANGGFLTQPSEFWANQRAQKLYRQFLRYVTARWGYSPQIASWEICNEIDLVTDYKERRIEIAEWHRDVVGALRRFDQGPHLITTNFANWQHDPDILRLPEISYSSTNIYTRKIVRALKSVYQLKSTHGKPAIVAECGDDFKGSSPEATQRYIPICLWSTYMMPFAGAGMAWWWDFIDDRDLYHLFTPLAEFAKGEDRRGQNLRMGTAQALTSAGAPIGALGVEYLHNERSGYFWVYETELLSAEFDGKLEPRENCVVRLSGLADGNFCVEIWSTEKGIPIENKEARSVKGVLEIPLPPFTGHVAGKVKPASDSESESPNPASP